MPTRHHQPTPLHPAIHEFTLTTILLFLAVTVMRWLREPESPLYISDLAVALVVIGFVSGAILTGLILSPLGRRSGGHMNPAVTVALWLLDTFPGRRVAPYVVAQMAGSIVGTSLARVVWGREAATRSVAYAAIRPAPSWDPSSVFVAEVAGMMAVILVVGVVLARPRYLFLMAYAIGLSVALVIAVMGIRSGGSINPARQFGPALLSGQTTDLAIYLVAPVLGAVGGAALYHLARRRPSDLGDQLDLDGRVERQR